MMMRKDNQPDRDPVAEDNDKYPIVICHDSSRPDMLWRGETYKKKEGTQ